MGRVTSVGWRVVSWWVSGLEEYGMAYASEVLCCLQDCPCGLKNVRDAVLLGVADVEVAVVEGSKDLLPCLQRLALMLQKCSWGYNITRTNCGTTRPFSLASPSRAG